LRNKIKQIARELLTRHGYRGLRFQDIAERLAITRGNIHYHFGGKQTLAEEVIVDYVEETLASFRSIWEPSDLTLNEKILRTVEFNKKRYSDFNSLSRTGEPWSLIARMRLDRNLLSPRSSEALADFGVRLHDLMRSGLTTAVEKGELVEDTPIDDLALQLVSVANSAAAITQDAGSFDRLEQLYLGILRVIIHAYGANERRTRSSGRTPVGTRSERKRGR
jgi:TetR/AcrR family transcriptional regulator, transcriptional repressor for nem operon